VEIVLNDLDLSDLLKRGFISDRGHAGANITIRLTQDRYTPGEKSD